jgi:hypothetical protein
MYSIYPAERHSINRSEFLLSMTVLRIRLLTSSSLPSKREEISILPSNPIPLPVISMASFKVISHKGGGSIGFKTSTPMAINRVRSFPTRPWQ